MNKGHLLLCQLKLSANEKNSALIPEPIHFIEIFWK